MTRRGSENRLKDHAVLVRMTEDDYLNLTARATQEKTTCAAYLRRCMRDADPAISRARASDATKILSEHDRVLLANATRSMGHLAGLMKLASLKTPVPGSSGSFRSILDEHHRSLQDLQEEIRRLLERAK